MLLHLQSPTNRLHLPRRSRLGAPKTHSEKWSLLAGFGWQVSERRTFPTPPSSHDLQVETLPDEPLVAGFDVSGGGSAWNVIRFRQGLNARVLPPIRITGEQGRDRSVLVGVCAELLRDTRPGHRVAALFVDSAFGAPIVERLYALGFRQVVHEVNFGGHSPDPHQEDMRAYMYAKTKDWLLKGAIPADDETLAQQLCLPGYHINRSGRLVIESKSDLQKRGELSH